VATDEEIAWAAGLFEGEGSITVSSGTPRLQMKLSDAPVLVRFAEVVSVGKIYGPYGPYRRSFPTSLQKLPFWMWVCEREAAQVVAAFAPWLGRRRLDRARELGLLGPTVFPWNRIGQRQREDHARAPGTRLELECPLHPRGELARDGEPEAAP
jgi:hypothetical protein